MENRCKKQYEWISKLSLLLHSPLINFATTRLLNLFSIIYIQLHDTDVAASHRDFSTCHMTQMYFGFIGVNTAGLISKKITVYYHY